MHGARPRGWLALAVAVLAAGACAPAHAQLAELPGSDCSLYASPLGTGSAPGTRLLPLATVQQIADRLGPGQTGCLLPGVFSGDVVIRRGGVATAPLTIRALSPLTATLSGQLRVDDGANFVHVRDLRLTGLANGVERPSPLINGDDARFEGNDVSNPTDTCFGLGDKVWGVADRTVIAGNTIHHCGVHGTNRDHGVYVRQANDTVVEGNVIRDNPDRGVQLFPNADRTVVRGNLIDRNGEGVIFSGDSVDTSDDNLVTGNIIRRSRLRWDVEAYWWRGVGHGNVVRGNCVAGGARGPIQPPVGFTARANVLAPRACTLRPPTTP